MSELKETIENAIKEKPFGLNFDFENMSDADKQAVKDSAMDFLGQVMNGESEESENTEVQIPEFIGKALESLLSGLIQATADPEEVLDAKTQEKDTRSIDKSIRPIEINIKIGKISF